jgi:hypothetical protein
MGEIMCMAVGGIVILAHIAMDRAARSARRVSVRSGTTVDHAVRIQTQSACHAQAICRTHTSRPQASLIKQTTAPGPAAQATTSENWTRIAWRVLLRNVTRLANIVGHVGPTMTRPVYLARLNHPIHTSQQQAILHQQTIVPGRVLVDTTLVVRHAQYVRRAFALSVSIVDLVDPTQMRIVSLAQATPWTRTLHPWEAPP